ncbi:unnamed protein product [Blepharisma stoltei]|uniref:Uncharacterized protein n=1 Tax=Blepharisma stoltei TaxID=1481888 RepID=A0AAU9IEM2_9CILI|nr:unnamed protein product [Blepharisma stoltei]
MIKSEAIFCLFYLTFLFASHSKAENISDKIQNDLKDHIYYHVFFVEDSFNNINSAENLRFKNEPLLEALSKQAFSRLITNNFSFEEEKSCKRYYNAFSTKTSEEYILFLLGKISQDDKISLKKCKNHSIYLAFLNIDDIKNIREVLISKDLNIENYYEKEIRFEHININELIMIVDSEMLSQDCNPTISQCKNCTQASPELCDQCNTGYYLSSFGNECCISPSCNTCPETMLAILVCQAIIFMIQTVCPAQMVAQCVMGQIYA